MEVIDIATNDTLLGANFDNTLMMTTLVANRENEDLCPADASTTLSPDTMAAHAWVNEPLERYEVMLDFSKNGKLQMRVSCYSKNI